MAKILLVEDDKSLREIYGVRLMAEGYEIVSAGDGEEALAVAIKERPDLIISDVMMPKISGFDMLDILRSTTETRDIKVIMMTALSSEDQRARGESLGADKYLVKSQVGIEDVVRTVHEVLGDAPTGSPAPATSDFGGPLPAPSAPQPATTAIPAPAAPQATSPTVPTPQPATPVEPPVINAPTPAPIVQPQPAPVPQPAEPSGLAVGERVINPLPSASSPLPTSDIAAQMAQELGAAAQPQPAPQPVAQPQPSVNPPAA